MYTYDHIREVCEENSRLSEEVIDKFLIHFAASRDGLEKKMEKRFAAYKHVTRDFPDSWVNMMKAQYLAHQIFKTNGMIHKLLGHLELKRLKSEERRFLEEQAKNYWEFSFAKIDSEPAEDFYEMEDVFSGLGYTLYSPGMTDLKKSQHPILWLNLIAYNGYCYQSYGPIGAFSSFEPDDIYFFATEIDLGILDEADLLVKLDNNPLPYMMLLSGANYPLTVHQKDQLVHLWSEYQIEQLDCQDLRNRFKSEYNQGIYRFSLKNWSDHPHFVQAYYTEHSRELILTAHTDRGYAALIRALRKYDLELEDEAHIRINMSMLVTAKRILKKDISPNILDRNFPDPGTPEKDETVNRINDFLALVLPDINAGRKPDTRWAGEQTGILPEDAERIVSDVLKKKDGL